MASVSFTVHVLILILIAGVCMCQVPVISTIPPHIQVSEGLPSGTVLASFSAYHQDSAKYVLIRVESSETSEIVYVHQTTGNNITADIITTVILDRDGNGYPGKPQVVLKFVAIDDVSNQIHFDITLYLSDINDNNPVFSNQPYSWNVKELPYLGNETFTKIQALDIDSGNFGTTGIRYHMEPKSQEDQQLYNGSFTIDPVTGDVSLTTCLDYEINNYYHFVVVATDSGLNRSMSSTAELVIRVEGVQDEQPIFTGFYRKTIRGSIADGTEILHVHAVDGDQGLPNKINYTITYSSCGDGLFQIGNVTGAITTTVDLDWNRGTVRHNKGYCIVTVVATEIQDEKVKQYGNITTSTDVTLILQDYNDNKPNNISMTNAEVSTPQPNNETSPVPSCSELWNFQSPCNESMIRAGVTRYPHPASNNMFLMCDEFGQTFSAYCPQNEVFHAGCSKCASPEQNFSASCIVDMNGFVNPCSKESVRAGNLTFPHPNRPTTYIRCDTLGNPWEEECFSGSVWDQTNLLCKLPPAYNPCHRRGSMVQTLYPHYCNPRLYVQCGDSGRPFVHTCQKNYVFLHWDLTCVPPGFPGSEHLRYTCG